MEFIKFDKKICLIIIEPVDLEIKKIKENNETIIKLLLEEFKIFSIDWVSKEPKSSAEIYSRINKRKHSYSIKKLTENINNFSLIENINNTFLEYMNENGNNFFSIVQMLKLLKNAFDSNNLQSNILTNIFNFNNKKSEILTILKNVISLVPNLIHREIINTSLYIEVNTSKNKKNIYIKNNYNELIPVTKKTLNVKDLIDKDFENISYKLISSYDNLIYYNNNFYYYGVNQINYLNYHKKYEKVKKILIKKYKLFSEIPLYEFEFINYNNASDVFSDCLQLGIPLGIHDIKKINDDINIGEKIIINKSLYFLNYASLYLFNHLLIYEKNNKNLEIGDYVNVKDIGKSLKVLHIIEKKHRNIDLIFLDSASETKPIVVLRKDIYKIIKSENKIIEQATESFIFKKTGEETEIPFHANERNEGTVTSFRRRREERARIRNVENRIPENTSTNNSIITNIPTTTEGSQILNAIDTDGVNEISRQQRELWFRHWINEQYPLASHIINLDQS